jgi:hypothetical protein
MIYCGDINRIDVTYKGAEYNIYFYNSNEEITSGRTFDKFEAIASIKDWFAYPNLEVMYAKYAFIDKKKRRLNEIQQKIIAYHPEIIQSVKIDLKTDIVFCHLFLFSSNRHVEIYFYGYNDNPTFVFYWSDVKVFDFENIKFEEMLLLMIHWIYHLTMPSVLQKEFPQLDFGKLVFYFEQGKGLEGQFIQSWDFTEEFYTSLRDVPIKYKVLDLIKEMRKRGFDKTLRAGNAMYDLVLSRSAKHGLRREQSFISFMFTDIFSLVNSQRGLESIKDQLTIEELQEFQKYFDGKSTELVKVIFYKSGKQEEFISEIKYTPQIESLLQWLEKEEID